MKTKLTAFEEAEGAIERAIYAIPETETKSLITALVTYYKEGGAFEDLREALVKAAEDTFEEAEEIFSRKTETKTTTQDFETAICALLCEIENGPVEASVYEAREIFEKAARALFANLQIGENETGEIVSAVIKQFDIFENIE